MLNRGHIVSKINKLGFPLNVGFFKKIFVYGETHISKVFLW